MNPHPHDTVHVACLCAAWCRLCDEYEPVFDQVLAAVQSAQPQRPLQRHWIDIEDEAELLGDYDVETFPTLVVADAQQVYFAGPLQPQPETLRRLLGSLLAAGESAQAALASPEAAGFAARLLGRAPPQR